jgi:hypothetical protein
MLHSVKVTQGSEEVSEFVPVNMVAIGCTVFAFANQSRSHRNFGYGVAD